MTSRQQVLLFAAIVAVVAGAIGVTMYGLRDEVFPVDVGSRAPEFQAKDLYTHQTRHSTEYASQVVLVNLWATWCAPCRAEMPSLEKLYKDYGPKGLKIIGVNTADPADDSTLVAFVKGYGLTFDIWRDLPERGQDSISTLYKATGYPESFVVDKAGVIRKKWAANDDWNSQGNRALIAQLLGVPIAPVVTARIDSAARPR
jgi:cytochrome c biogenesis protein CcmG/thiol:disulfide interchange protein DsbE